MNHHMQRRLKDAKGLLLLHRFGWLRTAELGKLLWPESTGSRQAADKLARSWFERKLVLARPLPDGAGRALVLATAGVRVLAEEGCHAGSGKGIGTLTDERWVPPASWRHDLVAAGVLCELHRRGFDIVPEAELRRRAGLSVKLPDGLAIKDSQVLCLEVENSRKSGPQLRQLATAIGQVAAGKAEALVGIRPTAALVAFVPGVLDERGYTISHQQRVRRAVQLTSKADVDIHWAECKLLGPAGVGAITFSRETIKSDHAGAISRRLDAAGWVSQSDGTLCSAYDNHLVYVWENDDAAGWWSYTIETRAGVVAHAGHAEACSAAKQACAAWLAQR